ncbi:MAG: hypothetical protein WAQ24_01360 [Candidatus Saccharimonadales bacterium]
MHKPDEQLVAQQLESAGGVHTTVRRGPVRAGLYSGTGYDTTIWGENDAYFPRTATGYLRPAEGKAIELGRSKRLTHHSLLIVSGYENIDRQEPPLYRVTIPRRYRRPLFERYVLLESGETIGQLHIAARGICAAITRNQAETTNQREQVEQDTAEQAALKRLWDARVEAAEQYDMAYSATARFDDELEALFSGKATEYDPRNRRPQDAPGHKVRRRYSDVSLQDSTMHDGTHDGPIKQPSDGYPQDASPAKYAWQHPKRALPVLRRWIKEQISSRLA